MHTVYPQIVNLSPCLTPWSSSYSAEGGKGEYTQKWLLSLQTKFQGERDGKLAESQQPLSKYNKLAPWLKILQADLENEQAEMKKTQQHIYEFKRENQKLQQQRMKNQGQNHILQLETDGKRYDTVREPQTATA